MAKIHVETRYGVTPNILLCNKEISFRAKGLFGYIQSKPDNWEFSAERIQNETSDGLHSVRQALVELEKFGFLKRRKFQNSKGHWEIEYHLFSTPTKEIPTSEIPTSENQPQENPTFEIPTSENQQTLVNKYIQNKYINSIDSNSIDNDNLLSNTDYIDNTREEKIKRFSKPSIPEIQSYCDERNNGIDAKRFFDHYESKGWKIGKTKMKCWQSAIRTWEKNKTYNQPQNGTEQDRAIIGRQSASTIQSNLQGWELPDGI